MLLASLSLIALSDHSAPHRPLIGLPSVHANPQACNFTAPICSEYWYPSGPSVDSFQGLIYQDAGGELTALTSASAPIDFMDLAVLPADASTLTASPNFSITSQTETNFYSLEFNMANNFWGVPFGFGTNQQGIQIRQGIYHMVDRQRFSAQPRALCDTGCLPIDNPELLSSGLVTPNPCGWDSAYSESGSNCQVGGIGGTGYHLGMASGGNGFPELQAPGGPDLNVAAQHFVNAGLANSFNAATSVLTGISSAAASNPVQIFVNNNDAATDAFGFDYAYQICYLFTGSYTVPCAYLSITSGPITAFPGFTTSILPNTINVSWWMFTQGTGSPTVSGAVGSEDHDPKDPPKWCSSLHCGDPFDDSLYYTYNSKFIDGVSLCGNKPVPNYSAADYMWLCSAGFDSLSNQMEFAPCASTSGDPVVGSTSNMSTGTCSGTTQLSTTGAGVEAEDLFGQNAWDIPIVSKSSQSGYLNGWKSVSNAAGVGAPNFFTWLNAWNPNYRLGFPGGLLVQAMGATTNSVNPYIANTAEDFMILGNIYDSLITADPVNPVDTLNWSTLSVQVLGNSVLTYSPPPGTAQTFRYTLPNDMFFQDGGKVSPFDVAFSYLSLVGTNSFLGTRASSITGITILGSTQFDIGISAAVGNVDYATVGSLPILPGTYWTASKGAFDDKKASCLGTNAPCYPAQYTIGSGSSGSPYSANCALTCVFPGAALVVAADHITPSYDPITNHIFIGSGPWQCGLITSGGSGSCSSSGAENPPLGGSYNFRRFGRGLAPSSSISSIYFRSNGNLAAYLWSQDSGDITHDFLNFSVVASCFGAAVTSTGPCVHFQQGIGANGGPVSVGLSQVAIVNRFVGRGWVAPYDFASNQPTGMVPPNPVLHEGANTLNPASQVGCSTSYPAGGYDC